MTGSAVRTDPGRGGEGVGAGLVRFPVRTPTLPPATHTNTYVVGEGELLLVDPASPYPEEQAALGAYLAGRLAAGERVEAILLTHDHVDHVGGAARLRQDLGAPILCHPLTAALLQGWITVDGAIGEGDELAIGGRRLAVLHTPGHAPGHVVLVEAASGTAIVGDMVASEGTIVIDPPAGDMGVYLAQLARLRDLGLRRLLPAHGPPIDDAAAHLERYLRHRHRREEMVLAALAAGAATVEELVPRAYPEVDPFIYPLAARSLLAHLIKLQRERRAGSDGERWWAE